MEFRITSHPLFRSEIVKITNNLLPNGFNGDRRAALDATSKIAEILNEIGEASARAQGLSKPVTTAQKLRNSEHIVYLLTEKPVKPGTVVVTGLLKVGHKSLYIFDANGDTQMVNAPCLLDFYVHESRQRSGLGKVLYEHMLDQEHLKPDHLAIDRPSEKLIGFLKKHYRLTDTIPQMNNFVVYEGFFKNKLNQNGLSPETRLHLTSSPNTTLFGPQYIADNRRSRPHESGSPQIPMIQTTPVGRYAAPRPTCSMAQIIHNSPTTTVPNEAQSILYHYNHHIDDDMISDLITETEDHVDHHVVSNDDDDDQVRDIEEKKINAHKVNFQLSENEMINKNMINLPTPPSSTSSTHELSQLPSPCIHHTANCHDSSVLQQMSQQPPPPQSQRPYPDSNNFLHQPQRLPPPPERPTHFPSEPNPRFRLNKMHTGLKNVSFNVGAAVSPTAKMEFYQEKPEEFGVVKITQPIGTTSRHLGEDGHYDEHRHNAMSPNTDKNCLTEQGFFDLKFYHNKLW